MSVKRPKLQRRPRAWLVEDCRTCGKRAGEKCVDYKGGVCAPHAVPGPAPAAEEPAEDVRGEQGELFAAAPDGHRAKGGHGG